MSTDNEVLVTAIVHRQKLVSCYSPLGAAEEAVRLVREELGDFDGDVQVSWAAPKPQGEGSAFYTITNGRINSAE